MAEMLLNPDNTVAAPRHYFRMLGLAIGSIALAAGLVWGASREAELEKQMEAAIHREVVLGDLAGAMEQYRNILAQAGVSRSVAAWALLHSGDCMKKLGRNPAAYNYYRRVENEYADQVAVVSLANERLEAWIGPRNLKFEEGVPGRKPPAPWMVVPSLPNDASSVAELRRDECRSRAGCAVVIAPVNVPGQAGNLMQSFKAAAYRGKTVRLSAWLKLEQIFPTAAGLFRIPNAEAEDRAQLWLRVNGPNGRVGFEDYMKNRPIRTSNWTLAEITGEIDQDAQVINFGVMSYGGARAWIDDVSFGIIEQ